MPWHAEDRVRQGLKPGEICCPRLSQICWNGSPSARRPGLRFKQQKRYCKMGAWKPSVHMACITLMQCHRVQELLAPAASKQGSTFQAPSLELSAPALLVGMHASQLQGVIGTESLL